MSQFRLTAPLTLLIPVVFGLAILASPAQAALITVNFSGTVDLSSVDGGLPLHTFDGSITWDSTAAAFEPDPFDPTASEAVYDPLSYTLFFDGLSYTAPVIGDGTGSGVVVLNDSEMLTPGVTFDGVAFFLAFRQPFNIGGVPGSLALVGGLVGPDTIFGTNALPGDLSFLTQVTGASSFWQFEPDGGDDGLIDPVGTLRVSVPGGPTFDPGPIRVPEPATASLLALGLAGAFARIRRARR